MLNNRSPIVVLIALLLMVVVGVFSGRIARLRPLGGLATAAATSDAKPAEQPCRAPYVAGSGVSRPTPGSSAGNLLFGNGKGISVAGAVLAKPVAGAGSAAAYQLMPDRWSADVLERIKRGGFDFIRLVTTPTPLLNDDPGARDCALAWIGTQVDQANAAGLGVIVDMHFWPSDMPLSQDNAPIDPKRRPQLVRGEAAVARMLAAKPGRRVALELLNEPSCTPAAGSRAWPALQRELVGEIRRVAPRLPLILTGCRGRLDTLTRIDASSYCSDPALYWTFHYYGFFAEQETNKLQDVPFPAKPELANSLTRLHAMMPLVTVAGNPHIVAMLRQYLRSGYGPRTIRSEIAGVAAWAQRYGIPKNHVFLGEFAPLLSNRPENDAVRADQLRWIATVRGEAEREGFTWAYWPMPAPTHLNYDPATRFFRRDASDALGLSSRP